VLEGLEEMSVGGEGGDGEGGRILIGVLELCAHGHDCGCGMWFSVWLVKRSKGVRLLV